MGSPAQGDELTAREVAVALGVAERTVLYYVERGLLRANTRRRGLMRRHTFTQEAVDECKARIEQGMDE